MTEKASSQTSTSVRLTPSTAIDPLETRSGVQSDSMRKGEEFPLSFVPTVAQNRRRVDMPLDKMSAQTEHRP